MNMSLPQYGTFLYAEYFEYNDKTKRYNEPIKFKYKTYDDAQYFERRSQPQQGQLSSKFSLSIKTYTNLPYKVKDKVKLMKDNKTYEITGYQELQNNSQSLVNQLFPTRKGNNPMILHLNKDEV